MRVKERKITVKLIEQEYINNHRLAEYFARKYNERGIKNGRS